MSSSSFIDQGYCDSFSRPQQDETRIVALMVTWKLIVAVLIALAVHPVVLRVAAKIMLDVPVLYAQGVKIVAIQYAVAGVVLAGLMLVEQSGQTAALGVAAITLVAVGATLVGRWLSFGTGEHVGVGNGVLIQFMQVPLVIPLLILGSFLLDPSGRIE